MSNEPTRAERDTSHGRIANGPQYGSATCKDPGTLPDERTTTPVDDDWDVIVVGAGNAAMCAALAARERGAQVLVLERAPVAERGGNTAFTAGAMRVAYAASAISGP